MERTKKKPCAFRILTTLLLASACLFCFFPKPVSASAPWKYDYQLRGDEAFQEHARYIVETGITPPSSQGEVYYAGPSDNVQGMINSLGPGDTLYLRGGVYNRKIRIYGGVNGREDAYITIAAAPGEEVVFSTVMIRTRAVRPCSGSTAVPMYSSPDLRSKTLTGAIPAQSFLSPEPITS